MAERGSLVTTRPPGLVDVLDRILDKGLIIVGDVKVSLANVELLTLRIRLLICSVDKAQEIGLDWWRRDPHITGHLAAADSEVLKRLEKLERTLQGLSRASAETKRQANPRRRRVSAKGRGN